MDDVFHFMVEVFHAGDSKGFWDERTMKIAPHAGQDMNIGTVGGYFTSHAIATVYSELAKASEVSHKLTATLRKMAGAQAGWVAAVRKVRVL